MSFEYVLPLGLHLEAPARDAFDEGYEVHWRDDEDPPHYFFYAQVSVLRVDRLFRTALRAMPHACHAVLELRRADTDMEEDPEGPATDRWVSDLVPRSEVLAIYDRYRFQLLHDCMVGFGVYDPDSPLEAFVDDHKLVSLFAPSLEPFEKILADHTVPHRTRLETVLDHGHEHHSLAAVSEDPASPRHAWLNRRRYDVDWFGRAIRRRLGMRLQPQCTGEEPADDRD